MFIGINTKPKYQVRLSPNRGGKTGTIATRPDAFYGHNMGNATSILEFYERESTKTYHGSEEFPAR